MEMVSPGLASESAFRNAASLLTSTLRARTTPGKHNSSAIVMIRTGMGGSGKGFGRIVTTQVALFSESEGGKMVRLLSAG
jgi:hypothetical protein